MTGILGADSALMHRSHFGRCHSSIVGNPEERERDELQQPLISLEGVGRQTAVALSENDERDFLAFLRTGADVRVLRWSAPSPELLFIPEFPPRGSGQRVFRLWNTAFLWKPEFAQWGAETQDPQLASQFYLKNTAGAPLIEYSREALENPKAVVHGRVYWNTDFAIYHGPKYNAVRILLDQSSVFWIENDAHY